MRHHQWVSAAIGKHRSLWCGPEGLRPTPCANDNGLFWSCGSLRLGIDQTEVAGLNIDQLQPRYIANGDLGARGSVRRWTDRLRG